MALTLTFTVAGDPIPQGSSRAFAIRKGKGKGATIVAVGTTNDPTGSINRWRTDVRGACQAVLATRQAPGWFPLATPIRVDVTFRIRRPKSHYLPANGRRPLPVLRPDAAATHAQDPDVDKLARAVLDALTSVVYADDHQVAELHARKVWGEHPGADVAISEVLP